MPDVFLFAGESNPADIQLRDPTTAGGPVGVLVSSVAALPIGGTVAAAVGIVLGSTRALPLGGTTAAAVKIVLGSSRSLPLGGIVSLAVRVAAISSRSLPIGGSITLANVVVGGGNALPLWRWAGRSRALASHLRPAVRFGSVARIPLGGAISIIVANDPEASIDDLLLALLLEDDVHAY